jgi:Tripartite tricarboxylate transporter TctB family
MYIFLLPRAGFFVAAFLLLIGSLSIFDMPGWMQRIGTALVATLLSFAIFTLVLNVKMPNPSWFN